MTDQDQPQDDAAASEDGPRTEGVRIIGAQEAAEAVGRPDVARRRRRGEKRFGDRPDEPEPASDLPKIRISTSESAPEVAEPDRFGAIPVVRPGSQEPRWADDDEGFVARPEQDAGRSYGHARVVDDGPAAGRGGSGSRAGAGRGRLRVRRRRWRIATRRVRRRRGRIRWVRRGWVR